MKQLGAQIIAAAMLTLAVASLLHAAPIALTGMATSTGRGCQGDQICDVTTECTGGTSCSNRYENCQPCASTVKMCGSEVVSAPGICSEDSGSASCYPVQPSCTDKAIADPHVILTFEAFTKKKLTMNVTPETATGLAGSTLNYKIGIENKNPKTLQLVTTTEIPPGWSVNLPDETTVPERGKKEIVMRITSNESASDNSYPILIGMYNRELGLFANAEVTYVVGSRGAPGVNTTPQVNKGVPGQTIMYNVTVTNNDPPGFDPSTIGLKAVAPGGFNPVFTPASIKVGAGLSGSVRLDVTSPSNATEQEYGIIINATANKLSGMDFIKYAVDFCGNGVCDLDEDVTCDKDCPVDPFITCNGRCETELDDGLQFTATVTIPFQKFIICNRNTTMAACSSAAKSNACGPGKQCLCTNYRPICSMKCVDTKGAYYILLNGTDSYRSIGNYSYACPYVDLPGFKVMRDEFQKAKADYEKARSALKESIKKNATLAEKAEMQPCNDALSTMISTLNDFLIYANKVIDTPAKSNTTAARDRADIIREDLEKTYNSYCRGASGLLQISGISVPQAEKDTVVGVAVDVSNIGNTPYYGMAACDFTGGAGEKSNSSSTCELVEGGRAATFSVPALVTSPGAWKARCKAMGSLLSDCSYPTIHDDKTNNFTVYTKETYVVDVSGNCSADKIICSVRTTRPGCGACSLDSIECRRTGAVNSTDIFECDKPPSGVYTLYGYVRSTENCRPIEPVMKNASVRCPGCGDGLVEGGEQCEMPYTNNNPKCVQTETTCLGKLFAARDKSGFCTVSCGCSYDEYELSCERGKCGAECVDGETRVVKLNTTGGTCTCVEQCGSSCSWNGCQCETGAVAITGVPTVQVTHSSAGGGVVTVTATGTSATEVEIFVDGFIIRSCNTFPCSVTATYDQGTHYYYARAVNPLGIDIDPDAGTKSFTVGAGGGVSGSANGTGGLNTSTVMLDVSVSPAAGITTSDTVILSAVGNGPRSFKDIDIYVDGSLKKICTNYPRSVPCTYRTTYTAGAHTYFATANDTAGTEVRDPDTGSKSFDVADNGSSGGSGGGGSGSSNATKLKCYAKIDTKSCTYNSATRRYDVYVSASWDNGTHAHWEIEDNTGPKVYERRFNRTEPMAGPGLKSMKLLVHDVDDKALCFASETIYCGPGTATGKDIDIIFDIKNVIPLNATNVKLIIAANKDIDFARILNLVQEPMDVTVFGVSGNTSIMGVSDKMRIYDNRSYVGNSLSGTFKAGTNITLDYAVTVREPGDYTLLAMANYSGKVERFTKKIKATNCAQINSILAKKGDACKEFATVCDKPSDWSIVESCAQSTEPVTTGGESPLGAGIGIAAAALLGGLGYKYRYPIRDKINKLKKKKEEEVSIDFEEK